MRALIDATDATGARRGGPIGRFFLFTFHEFIAYVDVSRRSLDSYAYVVAF